MSERDEIRRLIAVIEKGAGAASADQNIEDLKLFANTASYLANKLDGKIKQGDKPKSAAPKVQQRPPPKTPSAGPQQSNVAVAPDAKAAASADVQRPQRVQPQPPRNDAVRSRGGD